LSLSPHGKSDRDKGKNARNALKKFRRQVIVPNPPIFDVKNQLDRIVSYLIPQEFLYAVLDCKGGGTGFVGITDRRIIFYDQNGILTKHKSMVSIPYNQIIGIASEDEGTIFKTSEITLITAAGRFSFIFRGSEKAHEAYSYIMEQILTQPNPQLPG
jgi:hypothetical protein